MLPATAVESFGNARSFATGNGAGSWRLLSPLVGFQQIGPLRTNLAGVRGSSSTTNSLAPMFARLQPAESNRAATISVPIAPPTLET